MRSRSLTTRRPRANSAPTAPRKVAKDEKNKDKRRQDKKAVQWDSELADQKRKAAFKKCKSGTVVEFDQAMEKLAKISSILERSATLEKDFAENLKSIKDKFGPGIEEKRTDDL